MIVSRKCNEVDVKLVARASDFVPCDSALDHGVEKGEAQEGHSAWRECLLPGADFVSLQNLQSTIRGISSRALACLRIDSPHA